MSWAEDIDDVATDLAFWYCGLGNPDYPVGELGRLCSELSTKFRGLAIMVLLGEANTDLFLHNLMRSARARLTYLEKMHAEGINNDYYFAAGRYRPVIDAIAAGDMDCARQIARLSPIDLRLGEYEDDHFYGRLLHLLIESPPPTDDFVPLMEALETYLDGEPSPRLDVIRALVDADQGAFDEALQDLIADFETDIENAKSSGQLELPVVLAGRAVCVECLALLRLAEMHGLATEPEYRYCPSLARRPLQTPFRAV